LPYSSACARLQYSFWDGQLQVQMIDSPSQRSPQVASDMLTVRQKLRESLTSALEMVVSKHLVKSVLGVVKDAKKETEETKGQLNAREEQQDAGLSHVSLL